MPLDGGRPPHQERARANSSGCALVSIRAGLSEPSANCSWAILRKLFVARPSISNGTHYSITLMLVPGFWMFLRPGQKDFIYLVIADHALRADSESISKFWRYNNLLTIDHHGL